MRYVDLLLHLPATMIKRVTRRQRTRRRRTQGKLKDGEPPPPNSERAESTDISSMQVSGDWPTEPAAGEELWEVNYGNSHSYTDIGIPISDLNRSPIPAGRRPVSDKVDRW
jgi:hypothetical protein